MVRIAFTLLLLASPAAAQMSPARNFPFGADTADQRLATDTSTRSLPPSTWTVDRIDYEGRPAIRLSVGGTEEYTNIIDASTMVPLATKYISSRDSFDVRFDGNRATGWITWGGQPRRPVNDTLSAPAQLGVVVEFLGGVLPLAPGYRTQIAAYSPWSGTAMRELRVVGEDAFDVRGQSRKVWRTEFVERRGEREAIRTLFYDQETGRLLGREQAAGAGGKLIQRTR